MTAIILAMAAFSFLVCLALLIKQFLPKDKSTTAGIKDMQKQGAANLDQMAKKSQKVVETANKVVEGAEAFVSLVELSPSLGQKLTNWIVKMRHTVDQADQISQHPNIFSLLSMVSPGSAELYGQPSDNYAYIITEDKDEPFQANQAIVAAAQKIVAGEVFEADKARVLYDWFVKNIPFGTSGWKKHKKSMRNAVEIFEDKEGVCAEMTILYIVMARAVGLEANYARVEVINNGKVEKHACPVVKIKGKYIYVDPGFQQFDAPHKGYTIMSDQEAVPHFKSLRNK
ncbi:MAG: transglutaminase-like domain-containing protein [Candidatus Parcubacteria bacterium]|nr:transglutaminase-like domain-containing protein [Candidatus Parcubacteria bacterium]